MIIVLVTVLVCAVTSWLICTSDWYARYLAWIELVTWPRD